MELSAEAVVLRRISRFDTPSERLTVNHPAASQRTADETAVHHQHVTLPPGHPPDCTAPDGDDAHEGSERTIEPVRDAGPACTARGHDADACSRGDVEAACVTMDLHDVLCEMELRRIRRLWAGYRTKSNLWSPILFIASIWFVPVWLLFISYPLIPNCIKHSGVIDGAIGPCDMTVGYPWQSFEYFDAGNIKQGNGLKSSLEYLGGGDRSYQQSWAVIDLSTDTPRLFDTAASAAQLIFLPSQDEPLRVLEGDHNATQNATLAVSLPTSYVAIDARVLVTLLVVLACYSIVLWFAGGSWAIRWLVYVWGFAFTIW